MESSSAETQNQEESPGDDVQEKEKEEMVTKNILHVLYILADDFVHYLLYTAESPVFLIH
jgi:hypothetical protein